MSNETPREPVAGAAAGSATPYYEGRGIKLYHADSRGFDFGEGTVITDPPFNVGYHYDGYKDRLPDSEYFDLLKSCARTGKLVMVHYPEWICQMAIILGESPSRVVQWVYPSNTRRQHRSIGFWGHAPDFSRGGQPYKNPTDKRVKALMDAGRQAKLYDWWEVNQTKNVGREKTAHPCQMPVEVMRRIMLVSNPERVIEPFAGSGSTLVAAAQLGIPCIATERNEAYCEIIAKRLSDGDDLLSPNNEVSGRLAQTNKKETTNG